MSKARFGIELNLILLILKYEFNAIIDKLKGIPFVIKNFNIILNFGEFLLNHHKNIVNVLLSYKFRGGYRLIIGPHSLIVATTQTIVVYT